MDTKSKSIKFGYGLKVTAVCFVLLFSLLAGFFGGQIVQTICRFGQTSFDELTQFTSSELKVSETQAFEAQVIANLNTVADAGELYDWKSSLGGNYITLDEEISKALSAFAAFKEKSMKIAIQAESGNGQGGYETTTASATSATEPYAYNEDVYESYSESYNLSVGNSKITFKTAMTEKEIRQEVTENYELVIATAKRNHEMNMMVSKREVESFKNFQFYIVSRDGKTSFTNVKDKNMDLEAIKANFAKNDFYLFYTADKGLIDSKGLSDSEYRNLLNSGYAEGQYGGYGYTNIGGTINSEFANKGYDIYICVTSPLVAGDNYYNINGDFETASENAVNQFSVIAVLLVALLVLSVYLVLVTGRVNGVEGIKMSFIDKVPTDIHLLSSLGLMVGATAFAFITAEEMAYDSSQLVATMDLMYTLVLSVLFAFFYIVGLEMTTSIARYIKSGKSWLRATFVFKFLRWVKRILTGIAKKGISPFKALRKNIVYKSQKLEKKLFICAGLYILINLVFYIGISWCFYENNYLNWLVVFLVLLFIVFNTAALYFIRKHLISLDKIIISSERDENGEMAPIEGIDAMPEPLKTLAGNLSFTQDEMKKAVDEAIKGEKMKTELITNVSHDLKTPLTSIISYVDLLKKCDIDDVSAQKYIDVLDEKSIRLKRLIEDLVEASKASSGAIIFNKMKVNLYELMVQAITEMEDVFESNDLEVVLAECENAPMIFADSQKTWRVIDNILSNAKKYSLEGTRIYVSTAQDENFGTITVKNTSRDALNIDPEELTERFVRGDSSRSREGSGLGLSIAKDLCTLQGGTLDITIDGDLFKVSVNMPLYK